MYQGREEIVVVSRCRPGLTDLPPTVTEQLIQNQLSDWEMAVTEIPVQFRLGNRRLLQAAGSGRNWRTTRRKSDARELRITSSSAKCWTSVCAILLASRLTGRW